jgi:hypothetical protein
MSLHSAPANSNSDERIPVGSRAMADGDLFSCALVFWFGLVGPQTRHRGEVTTAWACAFASGLRPIEGQQRGEQKCDDDHGSSPKSSSKRYHVSPSSTATRLFIPARDRSRLEVRPSGQFERPSRYPARTLSSISSLPAHVDDGALQGSIRERFRGGQSPAQARRAQKALGM